MKATLSVGETHFSCTDQRFHPESRVTRHAGSSLVPRYRLLAANDTSQLILSTSLPQQLFTHIDASELVCLLLSSQNGNVYVYCDNRIQKQKKDKSEHKPLKQI